MTKKHSLYTVFSNNKKVWIFSLFLIILCLWIIKHPYRGITHDSNLYTAEALKNLYPMNFVNDFYFMNHYQGKYSIFPKIYTIAIATFGIQESNVILLIIGQIVWLWSAVFFSSRFVGRYKWLIAIAIAVCFPSYYGGYRIFSFSEGFLTPRLYAEAFILFALGFSLKKSYGAVVACLMISLIIHPLIAIPGICIIICFLCNKKHLIYFAICFTLLASVLSFFKIEPFNKLFLQMDTVWLEAAKIRCKDLFILLWKYDDFLRIIQVISLAAASITILKNEKKRFITVALSVTVVALLISFFMGDIFHNIFIIQIQPWRSLWVLTFLAFMGSGAIIASIHKQNIVGCFGIFLLFSPYYGLLNKHVAPFLCLAGSLVLIVGAFGRKSRKTVAASRVRRLPSGQTSGRSSRPGLAATNKDVGLAKGSPAWLPDVSSIGGCDRNAVANRKFIYYVVGLIVCSEFITIVFQLLKSIYWPDETISNVLINDILFFLLPIFIILVFNVTLKKYAFPLFCSFLVGTVICAALFWDQRSLLYRANIAFGAEIKNWGKIIPEQSVVFWPGNFTGTWFLLKRSNFISEFQAASIIFSKKQAEKYLEDKWLVNMDVVSGLVGWMRNIKLPDGQDLVSEEKLDFMCKQYNNLDYVVLPEYFSRLQPIDSRVLEISYSSKFIPTADKKPIVNPVIYLYDCQRIRSEAVAQ